MKAFSIALISCLMCSSAALADGWGTVRGKVIVDGKIPERKLLHAKGAAIKDANVCAAEDTYATDLIINEDTKGVSDVFIYLAKAPSAIHPDLQKPSDEMMLFDNKACLFEPRSLIVRAGQSVEVISSDSIAHNTHTNPVRGTAANVLVAPNSPAGMGVRIPCPTAERLPFPVTCDYHNWMRANWLVLDHPYAAVTDAEGNFTIEHLPVGDHEFVIWHQRPGYLERKYKVSVKEDGEEVELKPYVADLKKLTEEK